MNEDIKSVTITLELNYNVYSFYEEYAKKLNMSTEMLIGLFIVETSKKLKKKNKKSKI